MFWNISDYFCVSFKSKVLLNFFFHYFFIHCTGWIYSYRQLFFDCILLDIFVELLVIWLVIYWVTFCRIALVLIKYFKLIICFIISDAMETFYWPLQFLDVILIMHVMHVILIIATIGSRSSYYMMYHNFVQFNFFFHWVTGSVCL